MDVMRFCRNKVYSELFFIVFFDNRACLGTEMLIINVAS